MTTKFNQRMYAKIRGKKNEPLSSIRKRTVWVVEKGVSVTSPTPVIKPTRTASLATLVEEITPLRKRPQVEDKGKDKADSQSSSIFYDTSLALSKAQKSFSAEDLKVFLGVPSYEIMGRHIHKLVQVLYLCNFALFFFFLFLCHPECWIQFSGVGESLYITSEYLTHKAKIASAVSRVEALEVENSKLKKDLIVVMDKANTVKEKVKALGDDLRAERQLILEKDEQLLAAKEKLKTIAAKVVEAFQQTKEYNTVLFSWYYKGFELLRQYLVKHPSGVDLENLDMEVVDQEMVADEASQSIAPTENAPGDAPLPLLDGDDATTA